MSRVESPVGSLPGIGPETLHWLDEAGIPRVGDLRTLGSVEAYRRLKFLGPSRVTVNALCALKAALRDSRWLDLPPDVRDALRDEAETIDAAPRKPVAGRPRLR